MKELTVQGISFKKIEEHKQDYICISDIAKKFASERRAADAIIISWLRNKNTIEFLGVWEKINTECSPNGWRS